MMETIGLVLFTVWFIGFSVVFPTYLWFLTAMFGEVEPPHERPPAWVLLRTSLVVGVGWPVFAARYFWNNGR